MDTLPVLYSFRRCPYAMRARLAFAASGEAYEHREVVLRNKPADMLAASPKGTVPVLVLPDGQVIDESLDVMRWALARKDPGHWLTPANASLPEMLTLIAASDGLLKHDLDRYKYPNRYPQESAGDETGFSVKHRSAAALWLAGVNAQLAASGSGWLFGPGASLADMALLPFVRQFAHTDPEWFNAQPWPHLIAWLTAFEASAVFMGVMQKHAPWEPAAVERSEPA